MNYNIPSRTSASIDSEGAEMKSVFSWPFVFVEETAVTGGGTWT